MDNDDAPIGKVLSRREAIAIAGITSFAAFLGCAGSGGSGSNTVVTTGTTGDTTSTTTTGTTGGGIVPCVLVSPEKTEGPYFVEEHLNRSDIRSDPDTGVLRPGLPLDLIINLVEVGSSCIALSGAMVDVWHCDAGGLYSDVSANNTVGQEFLRGYQTSDANGKVVFKTIYPGFYRGRTIHIHFKIRATINGSSYEFTSQLFFDETINDSVMAQSPYSSHGTRDTRNSGDGVYGSDGNKLLLSLLQTNDGYQGTFDVGLVV